MPKSKRAWKEEDIAKLKAMAGKVPGERIAAELGRTLGALAVKACELGLSLRTIPRGKRARVDGDSATAEASRNFSRGESGTIAGRPEVPRGLA
jgi:hypothetical protein